MIDLPDDPSPNSAEVALVDYGAFLIPPLGGPVQRVERMGNRFRISVTFPPMPSHTTGRRFVARIVRGQSEGLRMEFPLLGFDPGLPGSPVVNLSGQTGRILNIRGATPNYIFREGQFFSVMTGGRHHLIMVDSETICSATGTAALPVSPMLRVAHLDGDALHVAQPKIEGFTQGDQRAWSLSIEHHIGLGFDLVEAA